jgi:YegS/Rv2252/BmrU family lipid kinase
MSPPTPQRLLIAVNPNASRAAEALPKLSAWFAARGHKVVVVDSKEALSALTREQGPRADLIVIGGGDGTLSEALPALIEINKPLAVLPLGTANDFARTLGVPLDPLEAAEVALAGEARRIDLGLANGTPFLNVASVGLATQVVAEQSKALKRRWRVFSYAIGLFRAVRAMQPFFAELEIDGNARWSAPVHQVSIGNGRHHGGGLIVAEDAAIDDGKLDLYVVRPGTFWQLFVCLTHLRFGLMKPAVLDRHTATRVTLRTNGARPVNADGRLVTNTPAEFALLPRRLSVVAPQQQRNAAPGLAALAEPV